MDKKVYGVLSFISLIIGMAIYLFFRDFDMVLFHLLPKPHFLAGFFIPVPSSVFSSVFLYNLPDALWFLSGIYLIKVTQRYSYTGTYILTIR